MPSLINNCINIENNIQDINSLKENLNKTMLMNTIMQFISDEEELFLIQLKIMVISIKMIMKNIILLSKIVKIMKSVIMVK